MAIPCEQKEGSHDRPEDQRTSSELARLIRKLRWLGMEEEAQGLQNELGRRRATLVDSVLATGAETD